ncbi:uncharacterized protein LOC144378612 isoform X2 [Ictidomys tridecemlineatus]
MATYPPRRLLGARPLPSDPRRDPRRSDFPQGGGGGRWELRQSWGWPLSLRCSCAHLQIPTARHRQFLRMPARSTEVELHFTFPGTAAKEGKPACHRLDLSLTLYDIRISETRI